MADDASMIAGLGHNRPPEPTPYEAVKVHVDDLMTEARGFLDGEPIATQEQADAVSKLMDMLRKAWKTVDGARKEEAKPHDDAKAAIQARYKPLLESADTAVAICKDALRPFLEAQEAARAAAAAEARYIAEEAARKAAEAARTVSAGDLAAKEAADAAQREAKAAERDMKAAEKSRAHATGGARATTLRTSYEPVLIDAQAAARWLWDFHKPELEEFMLSIARQRVAGGLRTIPGFDVQERRSVV